ncbi:glycine betaine ABC transporter substrate-binding protein [Microbacterium sp. CFBP 8790]|uniref:glycine betaine ABC transporter substrate-binding protein n=1 Tax=unclassified Microbacterium TaxID=2609290 RepID=UPI0017875FAF|nr:MULTISPECIES: glycine betaine ABC transporter substrate-binding protein [unclassified Microbacterium]MBD8207616.1 glycine betaine ABC transporter substrate-binding protein [Microbacterium sp. CFBP 8801]MBD8508999.1 glycine betaine ABC transporter substrate-binding protein [Microbacterium sp. CFBP 8790]
MNKRHLTTTLALGAVSALALAGCASGNQAEGGDGGGGDKGTITLGFLPSWTDGLSTAYLLEDQLEKLGYTVEMQTLTEAGPLYAGLAQGDVDIYPSAWPELTHADYMNTYGDKIEDLGAYYDNAKLTIAVPSYVDIDSIEQLQANADRFEGRIYGIEPGAGLTKQTQETMLPGYGLDGDFELVTSSTAAMLTELDNAIAAQKDIAVTLWRPFWANDAYDVKDLEDPQGLMGDPEALHFLATSGFAEKYPDATELIAGIQLDDEQYGSLEDLVVNEYGEGKEPEAVQAWLEQYPDAFPTQRD